MSRATEFALALILLQAAIGFVDGVGMFENTVVAPVQNNATYNLTHLSDMGSDTDSDSWIDQITAGIDLFIGTFLIGLKIIFAILFVFPTLVDRFHVPLVLSLFIQAGIYFVYATWYAQYRSGKGWTQYGF